VAKKKPSKPAPTPAYGQRMVSVPTDLKDRMAQYPDVNWSRIAVLAFEAELGRIASSKKEQHMTDVIQRLKASKSKSMSESRQRGLADGKEWATRFAEFDNLTRLAMGREMCPNPDDYLESLKTAAGDRRTGGEVFAQQVMGIESYDEAAEQLFGEDYDMGLLTNHEYLYGFACGALEVWDQVESKI
jgi:hypothetical protein